MWVFTQEPHVMLVYKPLDIGKGRIICVCVAPPFPSTYFQ